jgi:NCS1 family nucleobase:cation symporter-1
MLSAIFPSYQHMANTLPVSAAITTNQLVGFIVYILIFTPMMLIHPSKLQKFLWVAFAAVLATIVGLFIWAVASNGGAPPLKAKIAIDDSTRRFKMLQAVSSVAGAVSVHSQPIALCNLHADRRIVDW